MNKRLFIIAFLACIVSNINFLFAEENYGDSRIIDYEGRVNSMEIPSWALFSALGNPRLAFTPLVTSSNKQYFVLKYTNTNLEFLLQWVELIDISSDVASIITNNIFTLPSLKRTNKSKKDSLYESVYKIVQNLKMVDAKWIKFIEKDSGTMYYDLYILVSTNKNTFIDNFNALLNSYDQEIDVIRSVKRQLENPVIYDLENL